jgi:hypothetical protein
MTGVIKPDTGRQCHLAARDPVCSWRHSGYHIVKLESRNPLKSNKTQDRHIGHATSRANDHAKILLDIPAGLLI